MTVKPYLDTRVDRKDNLYPVFVCLRHGPKVRYIPTGYRISKEQWNKKEVIKHPKHKVINSKIGSIIADINKYYAECSLSERPFNIDVAGTGKTSHSFNDYLQHRAKQFDNNNQIIMAQKVRRLSIELSEVFGILYFDQINQDALRKLETYLMMTTGNTNNTRVKKFKALGQFYQQAVNDGRAAMPNPFKSYKILSKPVKKDKLTVEEINTIANLPLQDGPVNDARNLFLFSYYCKGMRFENCVIVRRSDIKNNRLVFRSNKGNKFISVKLHNRLLQVIAHYTGEFIFPFLTHIPKDKKEYIQKIGVLNAVVNRNLKILLFV